MSATTDLVARILQREGGVGDVGDGKGITRWGQTHDWLDAFNLPTPQNSGEAAANYVAWINVTNLHFVISDQLDSLADIVVDMAVMSGHRVAIHALQVALGVQTDGLIGLKTLGALSRCNRAQMAREVIAWDMSYEGRVIAANPARAKDAAGWANRLADHVRHLV